MRLLSASTSSTITSASSPLRTISEGCSTRFVQLMSETWTKPSIPGSISTKAPNEVKLRTVPVSLAPEGYFDGSPSHGSSSICFIPREIYSSLESTLRITVSITSPIETSFEGWRTLRVHDISEMWTSPSTPF